MKLIITILVYCAAAMAYEDINDDYLKKVLNDETLLRNMFGCIVDALPCDDFGAHRKSHVNELLKDGCRECDYVHKHYAHAHIIKLRNDFPEFYEKFKAKYDPSETLINKLDEAMLKYA